MTGVKDYSPVPASNTALFPEGMAPSAVNDGMRQVQADIRAEVATKGADIASAATVDLGAATGDFVDVTGTTTITSLGAVSEGIRRTVRFRGALTLTHDAISLILPGAASITTAEGDIARFRSLGSGKWVCEGYSRADGSILVEITAANIADGAVAMAKIADGAVSKTKIATDQQMPAGAVMPFATSAAPTGWLLCGGQAVSRQTYADLFNAIGTTFGPGDGSTTFQLPDLRGRVVAGMDNMGGSAAGRLTDDGTGNSGIDGSELGAAGGSDRHTLTDAQMPSHRHFINDSPTEGLIEGSSFRAGGPGQGVNFTSFEGGDEAHPIVQPTIVLSYCIKT